MSTLLLTLGNGARFVDFKLVLVVDKVADISHNRLPADSRHLVEGLVLGPLGLVDVRKLLDGVDIDLCEISFGVGRGTHWRR